MTIHAIYEKMTGELYLLHESSEGDIPPVQHFYACSQCGAEYQERAIESNDFRRVDLGEGDSLEYIIPNPEKVPPYACPSCGETNTLSLIEKYARAEVSREEAEYLQKAEMVVEKTNGVSVQFYPKYKIEPTIAATTIDKRPKAAVPIEAEGIGGKEIIGYDQKPVGIVVESKKDLTNTKNK